MKLFCTVSATFLFQMYVSNVMETLADTVMLTKEIVSLVTTYQILITDL